MSNQLQDIVNEYLENKSKLKESFKIEVAFFKEMIIYFEQKKVTNIQDVTPKLCDFYHSYLTNLCASNVNLAIVSKIAGHKKTTTTQKYLRFDFLDLQKVIRSV